jgi:hypothetical protein
MKLVGTSRGSILQNKKFYINSICFGDYGRDHDLYDNYDN